MVHLERALHGSSTPYTVYLFRGLTEISSRLSCSKSSALVLCGSSRSFRRWRVWLPHGQELGLRDDTHRVVSRGLVTSPHRFDPRCEGLGGVAWVQQDVGSCDPCVCRTNAACYTCRNSRPLSFQSAVKSRTSLAVVSLVKRPPSPQETSQSCGHCTSLPEA